jgi:hypothetical protein
MILGRVIRALHAATARRPRARRVRKLLARADSLRKAGDLGGAERCYAELLELDDVVPSAHAQLALLMTASQRWPQALSHFRAAHVTETLTGEALESYVRVLLRLALIEEADEVTQSAIHANPASYEAWFGVGLVALAAHRYGHALESFDRALRLDPGSTDARANRGIALQNLGQLDEAQAEYRRVLAVRPDDALSRFHLGLCLLRTGAYETGWQEYEARLIDPEMTSRSQRFPRWDGSAPEGRTLLVYGEQGLGDQIMFASCLPDLMRTGTRCVVECNAALRPLFARSFPGAFVYGTDAGPQTQDAIATNDIDAEVPLGSLPLYFRRSAEAFPPHAGYLKADAGRVADWRARLDALGPGVKIGISWQGGTHASRASLRSIRLHEWVPIFRIPGLRFVSLQYTPDAQEALATLAREDGVHITHWPEAIADYDETAALVSAVDLTVSVCTAVVHLAGALGRPVWVMVPRNAEWRYGDTGETMPWYPSARLFRQRRDGSWNEVIASVRASLEARFGVASEA